MKLSNLKEMLHIEQIPKGLLITAIGLVILSFFLVGVQLIWLIRAQSSPDLSKPSDFAGSDQCRLCHPREYYAWRKTQHSRTLQDTAKNPNAVIADFTKTGTPQNITPKEINYVIGGTNIQQYLKKMGKEYYLLPAQYELNNFQWSALPKETTDKVFFTACAGCHATGVNAQNLKFIEPGVGCEACHGPGKNHIIAPLDKKVGTIISPDKLPVNVSAIICGSCHNQSKNSQEKYAYPVGYKAGDKIPDSYHFADKNNAEFFWPTGNAKEPPMQYLDWLQSKHSEAGVGCRDCHTVHDKNITAPYQTRVPGDKLCLDCHQGKHLNELHNSGSCISCHMPESSGILNPGRIKSHTFKPVNPATGNSLGSSFKQTEDCFACHQKNEANP